MTSNGQAQPIPIFSNRPMTFESNRNGQFESNLKTLQVPTLEHLPAVEQKFSIQYSTVVWYCGCRASAVRSGSVAVDSEY